MAVSRIQSNRNSYKPSSTTRSTSKNKTVSVAKGVGTSIQKNPIRDTNFFTKTNTSSATKVNILKNGGNGAKPQSVFRIDGPHKSPPKPTVPHLNTNKNLYPNNKIYQSLNHKPISNTTYTIAKNYDKIGKYAKVGGRALTAIAVTSDAIDIYDSYKSDGNKIGKNTVTTSAGVAGSWAGGIGGAVGGVVGGIGGAIIGKQGGETIAKKFYN